MKPIKAILATTLALAFVAEANAANYTVRISGSSAFRKAVHAAIVHSLGSPTAALKDTTKNLGNTSSAVFVGTINSGADTVTVETSFQGSLSGVANLTNSNSVTFMTAAGNTLSSVSVSTVAGNATFTGGTGTNSPATESAVSDVAFSDAYQKSTPFTTPTLVDKLVGVVPFYWIAAKGANSGITNISPLQAKALLAGGVLTSQLTGNSADRTGVTVVVGRDPDSGTRVCTFAECGFGASTPAVQYQPLSISGGQIGDLQAWPASSINGISYDEGNFGYNSGGTLATDLSNTLSPSNSIGATDIVTYMGEGDAATLVTATGRYLTYNGVSFGAGAGLTAGNANFYRNITEGNYTFWSYEHMMWKSTLANPQLNYANAVLLPQIKTDAIASGVRLIDMNVKRGSEGALIVPGQNL